MSPGMRAARALFPEPEQMANDGTRPKVFNYFLHANAAIIERETGVADKEAALKACIYQIKHLEELRQHYPNTARSTLTDRILDQAEAALTKATGGAS